MQPDFELSEEPTYIVEGDTEYLIMDDIEVESSREHADSDDDIHSVSLDINSSTTNAEDKVDVELSDDDSQILELRAEKQERENELAEAAKTLLLSKKAKPWYCLRDFQTLAGVEFKSKFRHISI